MAIRHAESFDYLASADLASVYETVTASPVVGAHGRNGTNGMRVTGGADERVKKTLDAQATWGVAFGFRYSTASGECVVYMLNDTTTTHLTLTINGTSKQLRVFRGDQGGTLLGTSTIALLANVYYHIEFKMVVSNTVGVVGLRVNGNTEINLTNQDTQNGGNATGNIHQFGINGNGTPVNFDYDDIVIWDGQDGTGTQGFPYNNFLGDLRVTGLVVNGSGSNSGFTPLSSTNISNVDEATPDGDTSYNYASGTGMRDTFTKPALPAVAANILAVEIKNYARKDDAGTRNLAPAIRVAGANYNGVTLPLTTSYTYVSDILGLNPDTDQPFTTAIVDSAEVGYVSA